MPNSYLHDILGLSIVDYITVNVFGKQTPTQHKPLANLGLGHCAINETGDLT